MAYTPKELTEKYETLWEQVDVLYKEISELQACVGEIDEKYDTIWSKVSTIHESNKSIESKYESIWNKCNANTSDIVRLREQISSGSAKVDPQLTSLKFELASLHSKVRLFDKFEEEQKKKMSYIQCDMYDIQKELKKINEYIDYKFSMLYLLLQIIIGVTIIICLYFMYIVK
jgi:chromosome segregation ATPase